MTAYFKEAPFIWIIQFYLQLSLSFFHNNYSNHQLSKAFLVNTSFSPDNVAHANQSAVFGQDCEVEKGALMDPHQETLKEKKSNHGGRTIKISQKAL